MKSLINSIINIFFILILTVFILAKGKYVFDDDKNSREIISDDDSDKLQLEDVKRAKRSADFVFMDSDKNHFNPSPMGIAPCTEASNGFCFEAQNYPTEHINSLLRGDSKKKNLLFDDPVPIIQRFGPEEETMCVSSSQYTQLQAGENKDKNWRFIVNHENYTQKVKIEKCTNIGQPCQMAQIFPIGYVTECRQEFSSRILLALDADGELVSDVFELPTCCKCIFKHGTA